MFSCLKCVLVLVLCLFIEIKCVETSEKWINLIERTKGLSKNILINNLTYATEPFRERYNNERCFNDVMQFYEGIQQSLQWAVKMYDSWGHFPSGILSGNVYDFGYFDECSVADMSTQYCLVEVNISMKPEILSFNDQTKIRVGTCYPSSCSPNLTAVLYQTFIDESNVVVKASGIKCYINDSNIGFDFTPLQIFTICLFSLVICLIVSSTMVELFFDIRNSHVLLRVWKAFSAYKNLSDLCDTQTSKTENKFACLDGLRAISIVWVVYGHSILNMQRSAVMNKMDVATWSHNLWTIISWSTFNFAVDTFFVIGGFLATRSIKNQFEHDNRSYINKFFSIPRMWFHRYMRIAPVVISVVLFFSTIGTQLGKGPFWNSTMQEIELCYGNWWSTILFVQNYASAGKMCMGHLWYLAVDIQMFIVTTILLFVIHWKGLKYLWITVVMILVNIFYNLYWYWYFSNFSIEEKDDNERYKFIYYPTHARMVSWLIGVILSSIYSKYFKKSEQFKISSKQLLIGYIYCLATFGLIVVNLSFTTNTLKTVFDSLSRLLWASAIALIIFQCITDNGGAVNKFLSAPVWKPLAKLSFCIYVLHYVIQLLIIGQNRTTVYMETFSLVQKFWSDFGISVTVSIFWTLAFEMPFRIIERINSHRSDILPIRTLQSDLYGVAERES